MSTGSDVVIVGGGIVGCACAYELAKRGVRVTLLEYGKTGMQATNAAAGMLAPLAEADAPDAMMRAGMDALRALPSLVRELEAACGFGIEFRQRGILRVAFDDAGAGELQRRAAWQRQLGLPAEFLDAAACRELEPKLTDRVTGGTICPQEAWINNQLLALALERAAAAHGATIVQRAPVTKFVRRAARITAVEAGGASYACDAVVMAAGARSGQLATKMGAAVTRALPVIPVRGQMIALGGMRSPIQHAVWGPEGYLVPRANGIVFAGATVERVGFRRHTTKAGIRGLRLMAGRLVPQLAAATMPFDWAGLRPGTPDDLPIIGPIAGTNVVAATGHYRSGILLGPWTGERVAAGIIDGDWSGVPVEFAADRFRDGGEDGR